MQAVKSKPRVITRNRPSLSCLPCRRRKVKCGKQQPTCESCLKAGEACKYISDDKAHQTSESQYRRKRKNDSAAPEYRPASSYNESSSCGPPFERSAFTNATAKSLTGLPNTAASSSNSSDSRALERGIFHSVSGARTKYVEQTYWAFLKNHEGVATGLLRRAFSNGTGVNALWPNIDVAGLANLSKTVPSKIVCDFCLRSFMTCVRPVLPLVHEHSFTRNYENFFKFQEDRPDKLSDDNLIEDPTILSTIFAVLYCGAIVAPIEFWADEDIRDINRKDLIGRLSYIYHSALSYCRGSHYPTLSTLTALVLGESCSTPKEITLADVGLVSVMVKIAQGLGLHRDQNQQSLDAISAELRRRLWWHILSLDLSLSISTGSATTWNILGSDVKMIRDVRDTDLSAGALDSEPLLLPVGTPSPSIIFSIARFELVRTLKPLTDFVHLGQRMSQAHLSKFIMSTTMLSSRLDDLMQRIPAKGIPEKGFIPGRIATATPITHPRLYDDDNNEATALGCWARIMMHVMKLESAIILLRLALGDTVRGSSQEEQLWTSTTKICCDYLRAFLQIRSTAAFAPYKWFCSARCQPLQPTLIILVFLQRWPYSQFASMAFYIVDEILDLFTQDLSDADSQTDPTSDKQRSQQTQSAEWKTLRMIRTNIEFQGEEELEPELAPQYAGQAENTAQELLDLAELDTWAKSVANSLPA